MIDSCTFWPEGWWSECCAAHDVAYASGIDRIAADFELLKCVAESSHGVVPITSAIIAGVMFIGVRAFGRMFWRKPKVEDMK